MTLSALNWKQLPTQTLAAASHTLPNILDAFYTAFSSSTYADGSSRTLGAGVAWTFSRYQLSNVTEAVYGSPPTNALNQKVIIAGSTGTYTPVMIGGTAYSANTIFAGLAKNAGNFSSWNGATPFTSGQFTGYGPVHLKQSTNSLNIRCYESQDGVVGLINYVGATYCSGFAAGGIMDPESGDIISDGESDGKLYALGVSGTAGRAVGNHADNGGGGLNPGMLCSSTVTATTNTVPKCVAFQPGSSAVLAVHKMSQTTLASTTAVQTRSGKYTKIPLLAMLSPSMTFTWNTLTTFGGRFREIWLFNGVGGTTLRNSGVDSGYIISDSLATAGNAYLLST
jgi:hypothetical protein